MIQRFSNTYMQSYVRDMARGRPGADSERVAGGFVWWPKVNGERVKCPGMPFDTFTAAKDAARDFKDKCRKELGEAE